MAKTTKKRSWFVQKLIEMGACGEAVNYAKTKRTFPAAWRECNNDAWLCWLLTKVIPEYGCSIGSGSCHPKRRRYTVERIAKALRAYKA